MNGLHKVFNGLRKGLEMLEKASKILQSVEVVSKNLKSTINDLENIWGKAPEVVDEPEKVEDIEA